MQPLRRIAATGIEGEEGAYRWRLVELKGDGWDVLNQQSRSMRSYKAAVAADLLELQKRVEDLDIGPRKDEPRAEESRQERVCLWFRIWVAKDGIVQRMRSRSHQAQSSGESHRGLHERGYIAHLRDFGKAVLRDTNQPLPLGMRRIGRSP